MVFTTILAAPGLTGEEARRAVRVGPPGLRVDDDHPALLERAGFGGVREIDVTERYRATARAWLEQAEEMAIELSVVEGREAFRQHQDDRRAALAAVEAGLLRRALFVGEVA